MSGTTFGAGPARDRRGRSIRTARGPAPRALHGKLLAWYRAHRRDLPWRRTRDAYAIWISEAMLQQTRVETVEPYWTRFLARFPTIEALARAEEREVLALWSGLGYYRRARSLLAAARRMADEHGGRFPRERALASELPGVGPYTLGAVLSIAYGASEPLVDGNVARVFCRLFELDLAPGSKELREELWSRARALVPRDGTAGDWNQALMELGATVCTPAAPRCADCPLANACRAHAAGRTAELPRPKPRRAPVKVELEIACVERNARWLVEQRVGERRMADLWEFPTREAAAPDATALLFPSDFRLAPSPVLCQPLFELGHTITHHSIRARVYTAAWRGRALPSRWTWVGPEELARLPRTGLTRKVCERWARS